jgi:outer membrane receptor protein involved in Fe transport
MGARSFWPNFNNLANYMVSNSTLWQHGKHTLKFGGEYRFLNIYRDAARLRRGQFAFSGAFTSQNPNVGTSRANTGNGFADMLLGWVSGGTYGNNQGENINVPYYGGFIQDDWTIARNLTLNLGLRYELFGMGTFPNPERQTVSRYLLQGINVATAPEEGIAFPQSGSDCGCDLDRNNWAPRIGVAWSATAKTVIRTGAGIFYGEPNSLSTEGANFRSGPPRTADIAIQQNFERTSVFVQEGFPAFQLGNDIPRGANIFVFPARRDNLEAYQWFFDVQQTLPLDMLMTVGYMGTKGTFLAGSIPSRCTRIR